MIDSLTGSLGVTRDALLNMRGIIIRQPHVRNILIGEKTYEYRNWATQYRGPLLICSAKKRADSKCNLPRGVTQCIVNLVDVCPSNHPRYRWAFKIENVTPVPAIPINGGGLMRIWRVKPDLLKLLGLSI